MNVHFISAQNLVKNPSFECGTDICGFTEDARNFSTYACNWTCPSIGTSDMFTTKSGVNCYSAALYDSSSPHFHVGSQIPRTGYRYAGIFTFYGRWQNPFLTYREYLQVELTEPLIPGEYYCFGMYVSLAEESMYMANDLGVTFIDNPYYLFTGNNLPLTPQISETEIITDSINWVKIGDTFQATSPAKYLIIGNFYDDAQTSYLPDPNGGDNEKTCAYYFIDDVSVERVLNKNFTFTGNPDICEGDSVVIKSSIGTTNITWAPLSDTSSIIDIGTTLRVKPQISTEYFVKAVGCNVIVADTIPINVRQIPQVNLGKDTTICAGTSIKLDAGDGHASNVWQNNSDNRYLNVSEAGRYSVLVKNNLNCSDYDEINISVLPLPKANLGSDTLICESFFPLKVKGENVGVTYQWSTVSIDSSIFPTASGKYWVTLQNRCGVSTDSINIYSMENLFIPNVLTLNEDEFNEKFKFKGVGELDWPCSLKIFNRWGKQIYMSNNYQQNWPDDNDLPDDGVYYYTLKFSTCSEYKGWIKVMR
ncbi:MAG TPA: gliding motility-associated C-terminal domain-containing protein [Cyclobacteriaceae bacterium]